MCCFSFLGQIVYGAVVLVAFGLTIGAMVSPGWTHLKNENKKELASIGIFPAFCKFPDDENNTTFSTTSCDQWFDKLPGWKKVVIATMVLAVLAQLAAIAWDLLSMCACCCKQFILYPLPLLSMLTSIFLAIAVIIYGLKNDNNIGLSSTIDLKELKSSEIGYSFYLACSALALNLVNIVVGWLIVTLAKRCL